MSKAALVHILERWTGSHECDLDSSLLTRFLSQRDEYLRWGRASRHQCGHPPQSFLRAGQYPETVAVVLPHIASIALLRS